MIVIGERINASNRAVGEAISNRDGQLISELAKAQAEAGADFIDVNAGNGTGEQSQGKASMRWLIETVRAVTDKPLAIDSDNPDIIEAALQIYDGKNLLINSVTAEPEKLAAVGPMAAEREASLVALAMGDEGIQDNVKQRLEACEKILTYVTGIGIKEEQIYFDPLVLPISVDINQGQVTLKTIEEIKSRYPAAKTVVGLSNISYGLPNRKLVNRAFLLMAAQSGLDAAILDPLDAKAMTTVRVVNMLTGKDSSSRAYIRAHRSGRIVD